MPIFLITLVILALSTVCVLAMLFRLRRQKPVSLSLLDYVKLTLSGVTAFIADTLGIGSFAVNVALAKLLRTFPDDELPAVNNGAQVIPGTIESLYFMNLVGVNFTTLFILTLGACVGGLLGAIVVSHLNKQAIRFAMMICFILVICLLLGNRLGSFSVGGNLVALHSGKLVLGFLAMVLCGALTSVGIGLFAMVQAAFFLLGISPLVAFPIMTTAGAMQQPMTTLVFVQQNKIPLKKTLILSLAGCVGVAVTLPFLIKLNANWLHTLLLLILFYNLYAVGRTYLRTKQRARSQKQLSILVAD